MQGPEGQPLPLEATEDLEIGAEEIEDKMSDIDPLEGAAPSDGFTAEDTLKYGQDSPEARGARDADRDRIEAAFEDDDDHWTEEELAEARRLNQEG